MHSMYLSFILHFTVGVAVAVDVLVLVSLVVVAVDVLDVVGVLIGVAAVGVLAAV